MSVYFCLTKPTRTDAEECFGQIINTLRNVPGLPTPEGTSTQKKFVEQYLMGEMRRELKCDEVPTEEPTLSHENILKLECNINITTNFMLTGIMNVCVFPSSASSSLISSCSPLTKR
jgi:hypothetical protein